MFFINKINDIHLYIDTDHAIFRTGPQATWCLRAPYWWPQTRFPHVFKNHFRTFQY